MSSVNNILVNNKKRLKSLKDSFADKKRKLVYFLSEDVMLMAQVQTRVSELIYIEAIILELTSQIGDQESRRYDLYKIRPNGEI